MIRKDGGKAFTYTVDVSKRQSSFYTGNVEVGRGFVIDKPL